MGSPDLRSPELCESPPVLGLRRLQPAESAEVWPVGMSGSAGMIRGFGGRLSFAGISLQQVKRAVGSKVGPPELIDGAAFDDRTFLHYTESDAIHQVTKVTHRHEVYVWRFVPFIGQGLRDWRSAASQNFHANSPMSEVGHNDECSASNAEHFQQQEFWISYLLQCLTEHCKVETVIGNIDKTLIQVRCNGRKPPLDNRDDVGLLDFHAHYFAAHFVMKTLHQSTVTTAEVDDSAFAINMVHDQLIGELNRRVRHLVAIGVWHFDEVTIRKIC